MVTCMLLWCLSLSEVFDKTSTKLPHIFDKTPTKLGCWEPRLSKILPGARFAAPKEYFGQLLVLITGDLSRFCASFVEDHRQGQALKWHRAYRTHSRLLFLIRAPSASASVPLVSLVWRPLLRNSQNIYKMAASKTPNSANYPFEAASRPQKGALDSLASSRQPFCSILIASEKRPPNQRHWPWLTVHKQMRMGHTSKKDAKRGFYKSP